MKEIAIPVYTPIALLRACQIDDTHNVNEKQEKIMSLYFIQDSGDSVYVIAENYGDALTAWVEHEGTEATEPEHIALIADNKHILGI